MGIVNYTYNRSTSGGEIITHLINATDGEGLHFDGAAGNIDIATVPDLGTKFSFEFIIQADSWGSVDQYLVDFGTGGRFIIFSANSETYNLAIYSVAATASFGVKVLDDLKVHHLVVTVDGTAAVLYDNGNQVATATITSPNIDSCTDARIGSNNPGASDFFNGTFYRTRFWNKTLTAAEVTASYENATVPFADQYGSQTVLISVVTGLDGWDTLNTWNSQTTAGSNMILSANASGQYCRTNTALEVGKKYRLIYTAASVTGNSYFGGNWVGGFTTIHQIVAGTNTVDFTFEFATGFINDYFYCHSGGIATVTLSNLSLVEIGCVVDLDLAFANPTQSLMVQDRAGNADGTSSATGVEQVTKIEQLNSKSARIGTTAATPADGELISDKVGIGMASTNGLTIKAPASGDPITVVDRDSADVIARIGWAAATDEGKVEIYKNNVSKIKLQSDGDSYFNGGKVGIGAAPGNAWLHVNIAGDNQWAGRFENSDADNGYGVLIIAGDDSNVKILDCRDLAGNSKFVVDGAGLCSFANGIAFTQTGTAATGAATTSSTLDHYEEGTWTPVIQDNLGNVATLSNALGYYTRIGRQVYLGYTVTLSSVASMTGAYVLMTGLPFNHIAGAYNGSGYIDYFANFDTSYSKMAFDTSSTVSYFWLVAVPVGGAASTVYVPSSAFGGNEIIKGGATYITDA